LERLHDAKPQALGPRRFSPRVLLVLLALSLPLVNPWVRGDGVGYYAFARALLIQRNLDFTADYQHANPGFREARLDTDGNPKDVFRTATGHLDNHFTVGPAMLWAPFLVCAHAAVLLARGFGAHVAANGFSLPYLFAMALGTLFYGFLALLLSYRVACRFVGEQWALLATVAIWWGSSLPVYMYFNPSWSHAHSAFTVALFFWYWLRTQESRSIAQWFVLALIAGLALNVYYPNALVLLVLVPEALDHYYAAWNKRAGAAPIGRLLAYHTLFCVVTLAVLLPTFLTKFFIYGGLFETGYIPVTQWNWRSPSFLALLFSANHGLFSWTPILILAVAGIFFFARKFRPVGVSVSCVLLAFYYFMASYPDWPGISSYGNRFFVSMTVFFVLGLSFFFDSIASVLRGPRQAIAWLGALTLLFVLWNLGLIFQWGSHMIPARGAVSWSQVAQNQFYNVPKELGAQMKSYLFRRKETLHEIEQRDIEQLKQSAQP
jgi:hypothetical protein